MAYTTIDNPAEYFNTKLYTGTGASLANTGVGFQPDLVWLKGRSGTTDHGIYDAVRGVQKDIVSNATSAETTQTTGLTAFGSDGFTVGALAKLNTSAATYVSWNWLGANTTVSNTSGTITSTVSANTTSGFSIVSWTGTGSSGNIGHGLGVSPKMVILKTRNAAYGWYTWHNSLSSTMNNYVRLDTTDAVGTDASAFGSTAPTSTVFPIGTGNSGTNFNGNTYIAYCFADVKGFSKFGSYTGNGSSDGTFVYCGFRPAWILRKRTDSGGDWYIEDNKRNTYNLVDLILQPNLSSTEGTASSMSVDFLSNGFKVRGTSLDGNASGGTYIYMAFAENPFVSSTGIPTTAR